MKDKHPDLRDNSRRIELHPLIKLIGLITITTGVIIFPRWSLSLGVLIFIILFLCASNSRVNISKNRIRFIILFSLMLLFAQIVSTPNGELVFFLIPQIGSLEPSIPVTTFGLEKGLSMSLRFLVIIFASILFVRTTDPTLLAHSLSRIGMPYRYAFSLIIALRFLPLFDQENQTVQMAQKSRGISMEVGGLSKILRSICYTFYPLIVSALSKAEALSLSMDGRGFGYATTRTYLRRAPFGLLDILAGTATVLFLIFCIAFALGIMYFPI